MKRFLQILVLAVLAIGFIRGVMHIPFGAPANPNMDEYFLSHAQEDTGANNVVTAIVFDYRGFDTLGEASVLFTAVLGVGLVLRKLTAKEKQEAADAEE